MSGTLDAIDRSSCKVYDCPGSLQVSSPLADGSTVPFRVCPWSIYFRSMAGDQNNLIAVGSKMTGETQTNETCASRNDDSSSWRGVYDWRIQHWTSSLRGITGATKYILQRGKTKKRSYLSKAAF